MPKVTKSFRLDSALVARIEAHANEAHGGNLTTALASLVERSFEGITLPADAVVLDMRGPLERSRQTRVGKVGNPVSDHAPSAASKVMDRVPLASDVIHGPQPKAAPGKKRWRV